MKFTTKLSSWLILPVLLLVFVARMNATEVVDLTCEYSIDPMGVDTGEPRLFWRLESPEQPVRQSSWQVLVASSPEKLAADEGNLWDSGKVTGRDTIHVAYRGSALKSSQRVFWKVRVWDEEDAATDWSEPATWTMGVLDPAEWKGVWIGSPSRHESLLLRKEFKVGAGLQRAVVHVSGLGHYELTLNGARAGDDLLSPGWTDYHETALYDTRDITDLVKEGVNAAGVLLGNGMYHVERRNRFAKFEGSFGDKRVIMDIFLEYEDGRTEVVGTDGTWTTQAGPITFGNMYGGEDFDARMVPAGWDSPGFDDAEWERAVPVPDSPEGTLKGHTASASPIGEIEAREPVETWPLAGPGALLHDFGQNASYMPRVAVSGPAGSVIRLIPGEHVFPDGYVSRASMGGIHRGTSWWEFVKATDGEETFFPKFFYIGSRYIQSQAIPAETGGERPVIESIEGVIVHSEASPLGHFETSNPLLNQIRELVRWAQRSNMVSVLTDCPHREKLGWLEQYHLNGPAIRYEYDVARIYTKGMQDMADAQTQDGLVPNIAPEYTRFKGTFRAAAEWGAAYIVVPWQQYLFSGDIELIRRHYPRMKRYFNYLESRAEGNILSEGLGDWFDLGPVSPPGRAQLTPSPVTATAFFFYDAKLLSRMAALLGADEDAEHFSDRAGAIRDSYNREFYNEKGGYYATNSQCANALPLRMGIVEEKNREIVLSSLLKDVEERGYAMTAGDVGFRFLLLALSDSGHDEAIYRMINQDDKPGYGYQIRMGATALTEAWDGNAVTSNNHFMLGHITEWFYQRLVGIGPDPENPGFRHVILDPRPVGDLDRVEGSYDSLHGTIRVEWKRDEDRFTYAVTLPPNTTGTLRLPSDPDGNIKVDGDGPGQATGVRFVRREDGRAVFELESGSHEFETLLTRE